MMNMQYSLENIEITMPKLKSEKNVRIGRNNKRKGAARELLVKSQLEAQGWCVTKAGGSLGVFDLIGIHPDVNVCLLIQVKSNHKPIPKERDRILAFLVPNYCQKLIWIIKDRKPREPEIYHCDKTLTPIWHGYYLTKKVNWDLK